MILFLAIFVGLSSCKKGDNEEVAETAETAKSGQLTCKIDGKVYTHNGSGYVLADNHSAVKAENGTEQFTVNFYGMSEGDYTVSNGDKINGNATLQYFTGDMSDRIIYTAKSGTMKITKFTKTGGFKVSGTFSRKFEKFVNKTSTGITVDVTDGSFTDIILFDVR